MTWGIVCCITWSTTNSFYKKNYQQIRFCSFKNYNVDGFEKALKEINFPDYENFGSVNVGYSNVIQKLMEVMDKVAPVKEFSRMVWKWGFRQQIIQDKLFKKYKKSRLHVDEIYKIAWYLMCKKSCCNKEKKDFLKTNSHRVDLST